MLISPYVCKVVEELTNPYNKSIANKKVKFTNEKFLKKQKFEEYELNLDEYVHFSNITLQQIAGDRHQEHSMIDIKMNYIENIFDMLNLTKIACTGKICLEYNLFVNSRELHKLNIGFMDDLDKLEKNIIVHTYDPPSKINILTKDIKDFIQIRRIVKKIYDRLEGSVCRYGDFTFNSIALAANPKINVTDSEKRYPTEAHANILLIMKNSRTNLITIILYEPHGSTDKKFDLTTKLIRQLNNYFINLIQYHLKEFYKSAGTPYTIDIIEQKSVSCPEGIQTYINDSLGYCELISTLWLYLVLGLFSSSELDPNVKITLVNRLHIVESCLYQLYKTPEELYNVVSSRAASRATPLAASSAVGSHAAGSPLRTSVATTRSRHASLAGTAAASAAGSCAASTNASPNAAPPACTPMRTAFVHHTPHANDGSGTPPSPMASIA